MENPSSPHYVQIGQLITRDPQEVYCPICGKKLTMEGEGTTTVDPCKHLAFFYLPEYEAFEYQSDDFKQRTKHLKFEYDEDEYVKFEDFLIKAGYGDSLLALELTYGGIACGPISITIVVGYDIKESQK